MKKILLLGRSLVSKDALPVRVNREHEKGERRG